MAIPRRRGLIALSVATAVALPLVIAPSVFAATRSVTVSLNPWFAGAEFHGWGTTLGQWANVVGGYPAEVRDEVYDLLFTDEGLDLTAARYVIGAGSASDVTPGLAPGAALEGWWKADADGSAGTYGTGVATTLANKAMVAQAFRADTHLNPEADANQRWWIDALEEADQITSWDANARSAPYFMTESGYVSGNNGWANQLTPTQTSAYADYLLAVTAELEKAHGIELDSISPFYEPNTPQWNRTGVLEGMRVEAWYGEDVIQALDAKIGDGDLGIAGPDDTDPFEGRRNWQEWAADTRTKLDVYTTHSDTTSEARYFADLAAAAGASFEMTGFVPDTALADDMAGGLSLATRLAQDMRDLQPQRWILDQAVVDPANRAGQTGLIGLALDGALDSSTGKPATGSGFDVMRNYTNFIEEGSRFIGASDAGTVAALDADGTGATVVYPNTGADAASVTLDLSGFAKLDNVTVTPHVTSAEGALVAGSAVTVQGTSATIEVPARSVVTFEITGVSGVSDAATQIADGQTAVLQGVHSNKPLTLGAAGQPATVYGFAGTATRAGQQKLTFHEVELDESLSPRQAFVITDAAGSVLGGKPDLRRISVDEAKADRSAVWFLRSTDGGRTFALVNLASGTALDVASWATNDGAAVVTYMNNAATNQQWRVRDLAPTEVAAVSALTPVGSRPHLPTSTSATYAWGGRLTVRDIAWAEPDLAAWNAAGSVEVTGTGTDAWGNAVAVTARVTVGEVTSADPASVTTFVGAPADAVAAAAPRTVGGRIAGAEGTFATPVEWDFSAVTAAQLAAPGKFTVPSAETSPVKAELAVEVKASGQMNVLRDTTVRGSASFSEPGYLPDDNNVDLNDGNTTNKGWSNWFSGGRNASDRIGFYFSQPQVITGMKLYDGPEGDIASIRFQYRDMRGGWVDVPTTTTQPINVVGRRFTESVTFAPVLANAARVVVVANNSLMTLSEFEVTGLRVAPN